MEAKAENQMQEQGVDDINAAFAKMNAAERVQWLP